MEDSAMRIKLLKPHRHAGRDYPAGAHLNLRDDKADWLVSIGVAEAEPEAAQADKPTQQRAARKE
jgi:hypothetical protein